MSLDRYCEQKRILIQGPDATAYEAARALETNHVGAIVVQDKGRVMGIVTDRALALRVIGFDLDPTQTRLRDVMSPEPVTVSIDATEDEALKLMRAAHVRRLPILAGDRVAGIVTLDDLILSRKVPLESIAEVIEVQLAEPAAHKPAGLMHPMRLDGRGDGSARHDARAERTLQEFAARIQRDLGLENPNRALTAFEVVAFALASRIRPEEAHDFASQLPASLREKLLALPSGPDFSVTRESIEREMANRLDLDSESAAMLVRQVGAALVDVVSPGELEHVASQLPNPLKELLTPTTQA
ncbi:MAG: DUF2267 domain-containing protein [Myxococcota bacterium]